MLVDEKNAVENMNSNSSYSVSLLPLCDCPELNVLWQDLEARSCCPFFLSWTWISSWLEAYEPECDVLRVECNEEVVALGLLTRSASIAFNRFPSSKIHLHQTGNKSFDQIWLEYNGLLCDEHHHSECVKYAVNFLQKEYPSWDEFVIGAITKKEASLIEQYSGLGRYDLWQSSAYGVDLMSMRQTHSDYLSSLSRNTRYQIRKSIKLYDKMGGLHLEYAKNSDQALTYLSDVAPFHLKRWRGISDGSGFSNPDFVRFHEILIKNGWNSGQIDIIKVSCGERVVGYFYNFKYRNKVYFYLSGLCQEADSSLKPGLSGHALSIQKYMDEGYQYYDFMGGDERYKASLGKKNNDLFQVAFQKPLLKFKTEHFLRYIKNRVLEGGNWFK